MMGIESELVGASYHFVEGDQSKYHGSDRSMGLGL